jgi:hypothetical protein
MFNPIYVATLIMGTFYVCLAVALVVEKWL